MELEHIYNNEKCFYLKDFASRTFIYTVEVYTYVCMYVYKDIKRIEGEKPSTNIPKLSVNIDGIGSPTELLLRAERAIPSYSIYRGRVKNVQTL